MKDEHKYILGVILFFVLIVLGVVLALKWGILVLLPIGIAMGLIVFIFKL